jgi:NTP pyrophosphatase (non-canonical NTP hydrolase)
MDYTLESCQKLVDDWIHTIGVRYFSELTNTAILMEEVGELARIMARRYGEQSFKENERDLDLGEEMADILFVLICLANQTGVELEDAFKKSIEKKTRRDKERHSKNPKLLKETVSSTSPSKGTDNDSP